MEDVLNTEADCIVIGGGISGLVTAKIMKEAGFSVILLEKSGLLGGLWAFREQGYGVMRFTHINVSKPNYSFSDFPFPDNTPDFPHNVDMANYIQDYVNHFDLHPLIRLYAGVKHVEKCDDTWEVRTQTLKSEEGEDDDEGEGELVYRCKYLAIASGHHATPNRPTFPGEDTFEGKIIHSVEYNDALSNGYEEKKVVIVGIGNSAVDAAVDCATNGRCKPVYLSTRSGAWVVPNYVGGYPTDQYACRFFLALPWQFGTVVLESVIRAISGSPWKWGLRPRMRALQSQPTVSPTLVHHIQRGNVVVRPNIKEFAGKEVVFTDGSRQEADRVLLCTGYRISLPFLSEDLASKVMVEGTNEIKLFKNVFCPKVGPSLAFIGFVQPASGGILTMSETQAMWFAELSRGRCKLPPYLDMVSDIQREKAQAQKKYFASERHTLQKDPIIYNDEIASYFGGRPEVTKHPLLAWRLLLGSCGAAQWRLQGPFAKREAAAAVRKVPVTPMMHGVGAIVVLVVLYVFWKVLALLWC